MLFITSGCTGANNKGDTNNKGDKDIIEVTETPGQDAEISQNGETVPSLGGISLGDSSEKVIEVLGDKYSETAEPDILGAFNEDIVIWNYNNAINVSIGKRSGKVLRVVSNSPDYKTDLGIKVGDDADTVFETYRSELKEAVSRHNDETLEGWFLTEDEIVVIFDFDKSDDALVNSDITPDTRVEEIILSKWKYYN